MECDCFSTGSCYKACVKNLAKNHNLDSCVVMLYILQLGVTINMIFLSCNEHYMWTTVDRNAIELFV